MKNRRSVEYMSPIPRQTFLLANMRRTHFLGFVDFVGKSAVNVDANKNKLFLCLSFQGNDVSVFNELAYSVVRAFIELSFEGEMFSLDEPERQLLDIRTRTVTGVTDENVFYAYKNKRVSCIQRNCSTCCTCQKRDTAVKNEWSMNYDELLGIPEIMLPNLVFFFKKAVFILCQVYIQ